MLFFNYTIDKKQIVIARNFFLLHKRKFVKTKTFTVKLPFK